MPAVGALVISVAFLCVAISDPATGGNPMLVAATVIVAVLFMVWQARKDRSRTHER